MKKSENVLLENIVYISLGLLIAFSINYGAGLILKTDLPIVAVVSESMTHDENTEYTHYKYLEAQFNYTREIIDSWPIKNGFRKGDVLIIKGVDETDLNIGDVIVYDINGQKIPIVHRIVKIDNKEIITKGDHNPTFDLWKVEKIHGKVIFVIPYLGWPKIIFNYIISWLLSLLF